MQKEICNSSEQSLHCSLQPAGHRGTNYRGTCMQNNSNGHQLPNSLQEGVYARHPMYILASVFRIPYPFASNINVWQGVIRKSLISTLCIASERMLAILPSYIIAKLVWVSGQRESCLVFLDIWNEKTWKSRVSVIGPYGVQWQTQLLMLFG